jgi:hypothetical protein
MMILTFSFKDNRGREVSNLSIPLSENTCLKMPTQEIADSYVTPYLDSLFADGLADVGRAGSVKGAFLA